MDLTNRLTWTVTVAVTVIVHAVEGDGNSGWGDCLAVLQKGSRKIESVRYARKAKEVRENNF